MGWPAGSVNRQIPDEAHLGLSVRLHRPGQHEPRPGEHRLRGEVQVGMRRGEWVESERFRSFTYDEIITRDKANLDITWLKGDSLEDLDNLPPPNVIAREIVEDLTASLAEFEAVAAGLEASVKCGVFGWHRRGIVM